MNEDIQTEDIEAAEEAMETEGERKTADVQCWRGRCD